MRFMSPIRRSEWQDEHTRLIGRPIRSLSGTVAGFFPHISQIFFAISEPPLSHHSRRKGENDYHQAEGQDNRIEPLLSLRRSLLHALRPLAESLHLLHAECLLR
jgi:hypothetical protein